MKIVRCVTTDGSIVQATVDDDGRAFAIDGELFGSHRVSTRRVEVVRRLAPLMPSQIVGIGLDYGAMRRSRACRLRGTPSSSTRP